MLRRIALRAGGVPLWRDARVAWDRRHPSRLFLGTSPSTGSHGMVGCIAGDTRPRVPLASIVICRRSKKN